MIRLLKSPEIAAAVAIVGPMFGALIGAGVAVAFFASTGQHVAGGAIIGAGAVTAALGLIGTFT